MDQAESPSPRRGVTALVVTALLTALVVGTAAYAFGRASVPSRVTPGSDGPEAGFARDMQVHHIQGVEMAMIIRDRTTDPDVRRLAYDIATTQSHQAGQLYAWLTEWGLNQHGSQPPMMWMMSSPDGKMADHPMAMNALMPGMATPEQMKELSEASGLDAERLFLTLMIAHHKGALDMARAVLERSDYPGVRILANAVLTSQQSEIDLMTEMLAARAAQ
jgi:uncharacterized protein (DUF305 family)